MVLGLMLVIEPMGRGPLVYFAASVWALLGGAILIGDAVRLRRERQRRPQPSHQNQETERRDELDPESWEKPS
jgi:hypothetical protein